MVIAQTDLFSDDPRPASRLGPPVQRMAERRRDRGIQDAGEHADRERARWREDAAELIRRFAIEHGKPFLVEDAVAYAQGRFLDPPPDARAWGAAAQLAKRRGYIVSCGFGQAKTSNMSPKVLWRSA